MKKNIVIFVFMILSFNSYGQTKNDDILKLLKISGSGDMAYQVLELMIPQFQRIVPDIPPAFWERFKEKLNIDELLSACIPVYAQYYTHDEIKQLISFYKSPLGRKMVEVAPLISQEAMLVGRQWGEKMGQDILKELLNEGYYTGN